MITNIIIMSFYGRRKELDLLGKLCHNLPGMIVVTGRRRVGKTSLIKEFIKDKKSLYFFVDNNKSVEILMHDFEDQIRDSLEIPAFVKIDTPEDLLEFLFTYQNDLVVVFDEFQRFSELYPPFITQLQKKWDMQGESSRLFIIASGSSVGMMNKIFLEGGAPLFKRADNILQLKPFQPEEIFDFLDNIGIKDREAKLKLYLLFGGMIYYYRLFEKYDCSDFDSALSTLIFDEFGPLKNEIRDVLVEEFGRLHPTYYEIISALARGKSTQKEIADMTHIAPGSLSVYLNNLIHLLGVVEYRVPATDDPNRSKKGRYFLKDNFFRFYARFIYPNLSRFISGREGESITNLVNKEWQSYSGLIFEDLAGSLLSDRYSADYERTGGWWNRRGDEIDFIALGEGRIPVAVEVKNRMMTAGDALEVIERLEHKIQLIPGFFSDLHEKGAGHSAFCGVAAKGMTDGDRAVLEERGHLFFDVFALIEQDEKRN